LLFCKFFRLRKIKILLKKIGSVRTIPVGRAEIKLKVGRRSLLI